MSREVSETAQILSEGGIEAALSFIGRAVRGIWLERWRTSLEGPLQVVFESSAEPRADELGEFDTENPAMARLFDTYLVELSTQLSETTQKNLTEVIRSGQREGLSVPDVAQRIQEVMPDITRRRATVISRTELHRSSLLSEEWRIRASGLPIKSRTWISAEDDRVRELHQELNGKTVGMDEEFAPGIRSPASEVMCRCSLTYNIDTKALDS